MDLGHFRRRTWVREAISLRNGLVRVDFDLITAALNDQRLAGKRNSNMDFMFLMYFDCPQARTPIAIKNETRSSFSVAMLYENPATLSSASTVFEALVNTATSQSRLQYNNSLGFWQDGVAYDDNPSFGPEESLDDELMVLNVIHRPLCSVLDVIPRPGYCLALSQVQRSLFRTSRNGGFDCPHNYPSSVQPNIDQSQTLGKDKIGNSLPAAFDDLLQLPGGLPVQVSQATLDREKATLYWLFDKTTQLAFYAPCYTPNVSFASSQAFAPNFGPSRVYFIQEYN